MRSFAIILFAFASLRAASPNVIVIYCDDMGYGDLGCYGAKGWKTPHLDAMAAQGLRFTDFHVSQPVCSASRASLLTGCYANRVGIAGALGPNAKIGIHDDETTMAEVFKSKGYATGMAGKWHLGHLPQFNPLKHGFDSWLGLPYSNDMWPKHPSAKAGYPKLPLFDGEKIIDDDVDENDQALLTKRYTDRAKEFIAGSAKKPFFFYLAFSMPHVPLYTTEQYQKKSESPYGDIIQEIDARVGEILTCLKNNNLDENTMIVFTSDNGPWLPYGNHAGNSGGLREGKGTVWEGGIRVPCIVKWPGAVKAGVCDELTSTMDLLPTFAKIIGADLPKKKIDGLDVGSVWRAEAKSPHKSMAHYYRDNQLQAVRSGQWKLILPHDYVSMTGKPGQDGKPGGQTTVKLLKPELYDLQADRNETTDLSAKQPEVMKKMLEIAEEYRNELGDSRVQKPGANRREPGRVP